MSPPPRLRIGYTPLSDCAPLAVAQELGFFAAEGLDVQLAPQSSWATARDLLRIGALDAAHMLAPAAVADSFSAEPAMVTPMALSLNGHAIVVSAQIWAQMTDIDPNAAGDCLAAARSLGKVVNRRASEGASPLRLGAVFPESNHFLDLRRWLTAGGVQVDRDVRIAIVPPQEVERCLERGLIDGFSVGEPYGSLAVWRGVGRIAALSLDIRPNRIEKVLAANAGFAERQPEALKAMTRALIGASRWADESDNRAAVAKLLVEAGYIDAPLDCVRPGLVGRMPLGRDEPVRINPDYLVFHRYAAGFPWISQAQLFADDLLDAGRVSGAARDPAFGFRPDIYRTAADELGIPAPAEDSKPEGDHAGPWSLLTPKGRIAMGADIGFDRK